MRLNLFGFIIILIILIKARGEALVGGGFRNLISLHKLAVIFSETQLHRGPWYFKPLKDLSANVLISQMPHRKRE